MFDGVSKNADGKKRNLKAASKSVQSRFDSTVVIINDGTVMNTRRIIADYVFHLIVLN